MLSDAAARRVQRLRARRVPAAIAGTLLFVAGAAYGLWASDRLRSTPAALEAGAFDRPIARLARLTVNAAERLDRMQPQTPAEQALVRELRSQLDVKGRLLIVLFRFLAASVPIVAGLVILTATLSQWPLVDLITRIERRHGGPQ
jgi:hypothetical protein